MAKTAEEKFDAIFGGGGGDSSSTTEEPKKTNLARLARPKTDPLSKTVENTKVQVLEKIFNKFRTFT